MFCRSAPLFCYTNRNTCHINCIIWLFVLLVLVSVSIHYHRRLAHVLFGHLSNRILILKAGCYFKIFDFI